eukprot:TRINITY_DN12522_c0_g1_i3.p1 TRINITY_DN12522_c0_g1~~TRINITY_DN12522_c0_g1_i3.p1  ORF type:complete len:100 (-),score=32.17 TRINITY_DN12522_c0_g1_i3:120-419(-)
MQVVYNPEVARQGVLKVHTELLALAELVANEDVLRENRDQLMDAVHRYRQLPTYQINWAIAGLNAEEMQEIADNIRHKVNTIQAQLGSNALPLPRLFQP